MVSKLSMSSLFFGSVIFDVSAATGMPPELPRRFWMSAFMVMSMKSYARPLALDLAGTTHRLPLEPGCSVLPGKRNEPHWKFLISLASRPYHQLPETMIGYL